MENLKGKAGLLFFPSVFKYTFEKKTKPMTSELYYYFVFMSVHSIKEKRVQGLMPYSTNTVLAHTFTYILIKNQPTNQKKKKNPFHISFNCLKKKAAWKVTWL